MLCTLILALMGAADAGLPALTFDSPEAMGGWRIVGDSSGDVRDGALHGRVRSGMMFLYNDDDVDFVSEVAHRVEIRLKAERPGEGNFMWGDEAGIKWEQRTPVPIRGGGDWETVVIYPFWQAMPRIQSLRFDMFGDLDVAVQSIRVVPWDAPADQGPAPSGDAPFEWKASEDLSNWETHPGSDYVFIPPFEAALGERRFVSVALNAAVDFEASAVFAVKGLPALYGRDFSVVGDGRDRVYNVELYLSHGRSGATWRDPIVGLGLRIPQAVRNQVRVKSLRVGTDPVGPAAMGIRYAGFTESVNRAEQPVRVVAEIENRGGAASGAWQVRLEPGEGLEVVGNVTQTLPTLAPFADRVTLAWDVVARQRGPLELRVVGSGDGADVSATCELVFDPPLAASQADYVPAPVPVAPSTDVFMYYFPGWQAYEWWDCIREFAPERRPWLGYYDERKVEVVDWQIKAAVENGINGFVLDWYWGDDGIRLEHWVEAYERAEYRDELKLILMWCNHIGTHTVENMTEMMAFIVDRYFSLPTYYRIENKPVLMIWDTARLRAQLGGADGVRAAFAACEQVAIDAGYEGVVFLESGMDMTPSAERCEDVAAHGYAGYTSYHDWMMASQEAPSQQAIPYANIVARARESWEAHRAYSDPAGVTYIPLVESGWDPHPWHGDSPRGTRLVGRTPERFEALLREARAYAEAHDPPFVLLGPANEWGEGSYLEPCVEYGFRMYEAVRRVFGTGDPAAYPVNIAPADVGLGPYDFPAPPAVTEWTFDDAAEPWEGLMYVSDLRVEDGAMRMHCSGADPALGVATSLDTAGVTRLVVRMALQPAEDGAATESSAQFFWQQRYGEFRAPASVTFPVVVDGEMRTYEIDLSANPWWQGETQKLRFDPCGLAGVDVTVDSIRLLSDRTE